MDMRAPDISAVTLPAASGLKPERTGGSQAVGRALSLLSLVGRGGDTGLGLAELAQAAGVTRPTARRLLLALGAARMVEQDIATRRYHLGPETYLLGTFATERHGILTHACAPMQRLAVETGDTVLLTVPQDDHTLCLERVEGAFPIRTHALMRGDRKPMGVGAGALALLAALPLTEADAMRRRIAPLIGDLMPDLIHDETLARDTGHALNPGRIVPGSWGLGVVIRWPDGRLAGALSLAAIEDRMRPDRQPALVAALHREARIIQDSLSHLSQPDPQPEP